LLHNRPGQITLPILSLPKCYDSLRSALLTPYSCAMSADTGWSCGMPWCEAVGGRHSLTAVFQGSGKLVGVSGLTWRFVGEYYSLLKPRLLLFPEGAYGTYISKCQSGSFLRCTALTISYLRIERSLGSICDDEGVGTTVAPLFFNNDSSRIWSSPRQSNL
jgi:hypothetical protein